MDRVGLLKAIDRLGQSIVIAVVDAGHRRLDPGFGKALGVSYGHVLQFTVAVVDETAAACRLPTLKACSNVNLQITFDHHINRDWQ